MLDPNVLVSAFIAPGGSAPDRIVRAWVEGAFDLVASPKLLGELAEVLARPKFERQAAGGRAEAYIKALAADAITIEDPSDAPSVSRDPDDDYLFALARAAEAEAIVSGDHHLTDLASSDPPVMTPREFAGQLNADEFG